MYVCSLLVCLHIYSGDHGVPPSTPTDNITYIPYSARSYTLGINFTSVPLEIAYVARLITIATNATSYFFILPVCIGSVFYSC